MSTTRPLRPHASSNRCASAALFGGQGAGDARGERGVHESVDTVGHLPAHEVRAVLAARKYDVGAQVTHELLVLGRGVGDHPVAVGLGEPDGVAADRAGRSWAGDPSGRRTGPWDRGRRLRRRMAWTRAPW